MDPHAVLGLVPGASRKEATTAYRRLAKEWHPDRGGGADAERRMAQINAAYDLLRAEAWTQLHAPGRADAQAVARERAPSRGRGAWLPPAIRRALGRELLSALEPEEDVWLVTPVTMWASPEALLAVSDRRLLWLLDDAVVGRVHVLRFGAVADIGYRLRRPRRRVAILRVTSTPGRRHEFGDLRPATAEAIVRRVREGMAPRRAAALRS